MADEILKTTDFLKNKVGNTLFLEEAIERDVPKEEAGFSKWFCGVLENNETEFIQQSDFFDCWVVKANTLANIEYLKKIKLEVYELAKEHKRLDEKIQTSMIKNKINLQSLFQK